MYLYVTNMVGTSNYKNIKVKATPAIMVVKNKTLTKTLLQVSVKT